MLIETAVVTEYRNGIAKVRCETKKGCSGCAAQASCGAAALSELNGSSNQGELLFELKVDQPLKIGQMIEIGLQEKSMVLSALLLLILFFSLTMCSIHILNSSLMVISSTIM